MTLSCVSVSLFDLTTVISFVIAPCSFDHSENQLKHSELMVKQTSMWVAKTFKSLLTSGSSGKIFAVKMDNSNFSSITVYSFIRGYHVYKDETTSIWVPHIGKQRTLKCEPLNEKDGNAVAVVRPLSRNLITEAKHPNTVSKEDVGHIVLQVSQYVSKFLKQRTK